MITRLKLSTVEQGLPKYRSMLAGNTAFVPAFESIATATVGSSGSSEIEFASIPSGFAHLQLRCYAFTETNGHVMVLRINSDTGANYTFHCINGNGGGGTGSAGGSTGLTYARFFGSDVGTDTTNPTSAIVDILDYTNTNKYKTIRAISGCDNNGGGEVGIQSSLWINTSSITNIKIRLNSGANYSQYSHFSLYGIKAA